MTMDLIKVKDRALSFMKPAKNEVLKWFRGNYEIDVKSDLSPVTIADRNAEEILRKKIAKCFPEHGIIGEEFGNENITAEWVWTIDPVDGTRSFIRGLPLFASMIALLHQGDPVLGIIELPALGETAWAVKGKGAFLNGKPLKVSKQKKLQGAFIAVADWYCFQQQKQNSLLNKLNKKAGIVRTYPDAFGHLMAIRGAVDVMVDPLAKIWDYAPCKIFAEEAGGTFANFTGNQASIEEGTAIVGNADIVKEVRKVFSESKEH
ncbi:MAG: inositol monophosphatase family protein [Nitrospinota bacterium]|nr:inositol monophosphatase family protein [Nitrospinota bacterium]